MCCITEAYCSYRRLQNLCNATEKCTANHIRRSGSHSPMRSLLIGDIRNHTALPLHMGAHVSKCVLCCKAKVSSPVHCWYLSQVGCALHGAYPMSEFHHRCMLNLVCGSTNTGKQMKLQLAQCSSSLAAFQRVQ